MSRTVLKKEENQMKALLISNDRSLQEQVAALNSARPVAIALTARGGQPRDAHKFMADESPQLVALDAATTDIHEPGMLERFAAQYPQAAFMLLTADQSPETLLRAMRAGVREVLPLPLEAKAFNDALDRIMHKVSSPLRHGKVIAFISCKGGSGATFLATNFGHALTALGRKKVLLIDLNQQFGDAALYVSDKAPAMTLADVCAQIDRLDAAFLESSLINVSSDFGILAASGDPGRSADVKPEHIDAILPLARSYYDFIVLDVGRQIDSVTIHALDRADLIHPVLQLSLPYLRDGRRLLDVFRSLGYPREKARLIVNRYEKGGKLRLSDLESALGVGAAHTVPNNYAAVSDSVNQGVPILELSRTSPVAKSLAELVHHAIGPQSMEDKGFFSRIFNRRTQLAT